jgi:hypothetical protein
MRHLRGCVNDSTLKEHATKESKAAFGGHTQARCACPFCAKPTSALSSHLLRCDKRKEIQIKRTQAGVPGLFSSPNARSNRLV